jgi:hypothetical protein
MGVELVDLFVDEGEALASNSKRFLPAGLAGCPGIRRRIGSFVNFDQVMNLFQGEAEFLGIAD